MKKEVLSFLLRPSAVSWESEGSSAKGSQSQYVNAVIQRKVVDLKKVKILIGQLGDYLTNFGCNFEEPMTKTVESVTRPSQIKETSKSREASQSPPLVLKYLEALPPERELTLLVEVVEKPPPVTIKPEFKVPKIIAEHPAKFNSIASVVKHEIKEEIFESDEFEAVSEEVSEDEEEEDCLRIIEEKIIDVSTLPGRP